MNFDFIKALKISAIISVSLIVIGILVGVIFGVNLDINFKGGSRYTYSYTGDIKLADAEKVIEDALNTSVEVTESKDYSGNSSKLVVSITAGKETEDAQNNILKALQEKFADNKIEFGDANTVSPTMATKFFAKCLCALLIASVLLLLYIALRFRNIGGLSAGVMSLVALVHDLLIAFAACVVFRLDIDMNFVAVVLTILGYSLNDTIVVYDRIRENRKLYPQKALRELVNESLRQVTGRTITTSVATFISIVAILIVCEIFGLTTLRTFTIPMAFGIVAGSFSSLCLAAPLWVKWCEYKERHPKKSKAKKTKKARV